MWWWCTQRANLRVVDGIRTPDLEADTMLTPQLESGAAVDDVMLEAVMVPSLESDDVVTVDDDTIQGGQIG